MKSFLNTSLGLTGIEEFVVFEGLFESGCKLLKNIDIKPF
jgi:hypothetical protein|tara:strand:+ start:48749 stop:48868 length:120 start_codon:yes stop_codon:yes gene_type:complete